MKMTYGLVGFAVVALAGATQIGCVATVETRPVRVGVVEEVAYEPQYYNGAVVYYDEAGVPYWHDHGSVRYIERSDVHYNVLVDHYRVHARGYNSWYVKVGRGNDHRRR